jgi:amino acid adenylation domain-containing protein
VNLAGEVLKKELVDRIFAHSQVEQVCNLYGPSETTTYSSWVSMSRESGFIASVGRPIANTKIYILDRYCQVVPLGVAGEIYVGGAGVARGYLNRPELTAERFIADPFSPDPQARLYKSGDLGRWRADGMIEYLGRNDHQVKIRGFRVELGEIEAQLTQHEDVKQAVVVAREDVPGEQRLVAYVILRIPSRTDLVPGVEALRMRLKAALPDYMVPSAFMILEHLPLMPNGKLDRRALPAPQLGAYLNRQYEAPQGHAEELLAGIWQALLRVDRVGRHDHFFELGGHSLLILQMMERLRRVGVGTDVRSVYENPTLEALARIITGDTAHDFVVPPNLIPPECQRITPQMLPLVELDAAHIEQIMRAVPGSTGNVQDIYPLSPSEEGMLFHSLLNEKGGDTYILSLLFSVSSRDRLEELIAAFQYVVDRHDVLRTAVQWEKLPRPVRVVYRGVAVPVEEIFLDEHRDLLEQLKERMRPGRQRLDLRNPPLMRLQVAASRVSVQSYVLLQLHHLVCDHESITIMLAELVAYLEGRAHGSPHPEPYRNHVAHVLTLAQLSDAATFFSSKLAGVDEPTVPFGLLDVYGDGSRINRAVRALEPQLAYRIRAQARRLGITAATLFHAAWALVVSHTSGRDDVVYGTVLLGRLQASSQARQAMGMFINTLPLRLRLLDTTANELVEQTHRELQDLINHEQASLAVAQRCSGIEGSAALFSSLLNYRHSSNDILTKFSEAAGATLLEVRTGTNYPIVLSVDDLGDAFVLDIQADERVDPDRMIGYAYTAVGSLVNALERAPQTPALALSILPLTERRQLIDLFNATEAFYPREKLLHELFEEQVARAPNAVAVAHEGQSLTYAELNGRANQLARYLRDRGVVPDQLVGICVGRSLEMVIGIIGILKAGGAYVPMDPTNPTERLEHILTDAATKVVLTQERLRSRLPMTAAKVISLDADWNEVSELDSGNLNSRSLQQSRETLAYVIYTSGSTGKPKGVMVEHRNIVNYVVHAVRQFDVGSGAGSLVCTSISFDLLLTGLYPPLLCGQTVRLCPDEHPDEQGLPALSRGLLRCSNLAPLKITPSHLGLLENVLVSGQLAGRVRVLVLGGEALQASALQMWRKHAPSTRIFNHYGPTEATVGCIVHELADQTSGPVPIGRPIANTQAYILDRRMQPVPIGIAGEINIGGAGVARGYLNRPALTAERFVANPFSADPQARMYKTGDLGRWRSDGTIEYLGRNDRQVKIRGFRVELGEIEAQLVRLAQVKEVTLIAREDLPGEKRLVAYIVYRELAKGENAPDVQSLRTHLRASLPEYAVPSAFVVMERLPITPNGKLDLRALPTPELEAYGNQQYDAPQGEVEELLAAIWQPLLAVSRVGRQDNFFDLGGHSLIATRVISRLREVFQLELPLKALFDAPTVTQLSLRVETERRALSAQEPLHMSKHRRRDVKEMNEEEVVAEIAKLQKELSAGTLRQSRP